jgi:multiple sugar transport system substrate-binding protein
MRLREPESESRREALQRLGAGAALLTLGACGRRDDPAGPLNFWAMGREAEVVADLLPAFHDRHPEIRVRVQQLPWTAAHEKLLTAYAGDALPDLCQLGNTWLPELTALDALEPLDARIDASGIARDDYFAGILDTNVMPTPTGNRLFGVPWYVDTRVLFYRSDLLRAAGHSTPPQSWSEWLAALRAVRQRGAQTYGVLLPLNEPDPLFALALQQGALLKDGDTRGAFAQPAFRRALGFYADIFAEGLAPATTSAQIANVWDEFARGLFVFYVSGPWNIGEFRRRLPRERQGDWATAPLPGPDGPGVSTAGGSSTGDLPPRRSAWRSPELADDVPSQAFAAQLERVRAAPKLPEWERIFQEMQRAAERVVRRTQSIDAATTELDASVDALLEKRRWLRARTLAAAGPR